MNLLTDPWITITRRDGRTAVISPTDLTAGPDNPIVDITAARPDFRSALYQFLIGLLQTACAPPDDAAWEAWWECPPSPADLAARMQPFEQVFAFTGSGPRFMQDQAVAECGSNDTSNINVLLIDEPGTQSLKLNKDHFTKRGRIPGLCVAHAAQALLTMQIMAPAGGRGNLTSLRGGGPLTTLLLPGDSETDSLFHRVWLNILPIDAFNVLHAQPFGTPQENDGRIFPWMQAHTDATAKWPEATIENCHPLQAYWGMPRRIWFDLDHTVDGPCPLGDAGPLVTSYKARPYGVDYTGPWRHPLSPYYDTKDYPLPLHPQPGGFGYRTWLDWTHGNPDSGRHCAGVVEHANTSPVKRRITCRLWSSGYDMDNMKARCFYESYWPIYHFDEQSTDIAQAVIRRCTVLAGEFASTTRSQIKAAWLRRPGDHSDSTNNQISAIHGQFYERTEAAFFDHVRRLSDLLGGTIAESALGTSWRQTLRSTAFALFDEHVPIESMADIDAERIANARNTLGKYLNKKSNANMVAQIDEVCAQFAPQGADA